MKWSATVIIIFIFVLMGIQGIQTSTVLAQEGEVTSETPIDYEPLVGEGGIPGIDGGDDLTLAGYLQALFNLIIGIAAVLAVLMIVVGGLQYMTSDAITGKKEGLERLNNAVLGLLLALGSWLILYTINPRLLDFNLILEKQDVGEGVERPDEGSQSTNEDGSTQEEFLRSQYLEAGIGINNPPCTATRTSECTNVDGLPTAVKIHLFNLANTLEDEYPYNYEGCTETNTQNCTLVITGGTEDGHETHGVDEVFVDLRKNGTLGDYIVRNSSCSSQTSIGTLYKVGNTRYVDEGDHWHTCIGDNCSIQNHSGTCN